MNNPARIKAEPVPELLTLVRALARGAAEKDVAEWLAKQPPEGRQAPA